VLAVSDIHGSDSPPRNLLGCTRPTWYDINSKHMGCTDDWCCAMPIPKTVDVTNREELRRIKLALQFRGLPMRPALRRAWDSVK
jgi:hypothetical protein